MTKQSFLEHCLTAYNTTADYPFDEDFETAVLRHSDNRKWYAIVMRVSRRKFGSFGASDGVYPVSLLHEVSYQIISIPLWLMKESSKRGLLL